MNTRKAYFAVLWLLSGLKRNKFDRIFLSIEVRTNLNLNQHFSQPLMRITARL